MKKQLIELIDHMSEYQIIYAYAFLTKLLGIMC